MLTESVDENPKQRQNTILILRNNINIEDQDKQVNISYFWGRTVLIEERVFKWKF